MQVKPDPESAITGQKIVVFPGLAIKRQEDACKSGCRFREILIIQEYTGSIEGPGDAGHFGASGIVPDFLGDRIV